MTNIIAGQNTEIRFPLEITISLEKDPGFDIDASLYLLKDGSASEDSDIIFFNQPKSNDGKVSLEIDGKLKNKIIINGMPSGKDKIAITLASDKSANKLTGSGIIRISTPEFSAEIKSDLSALIIGEVYERNGAYRFKLVSQGFDGGLDKLTKHYGLEVAADNSSPTSSGSQPSAELSKLDLRKEKVINLAKNDAKIIDLTKKAAISLAKKGLSNETAKFCMALDISGSMHGLYVSGAVDRLVQRVLAVGMTMDDDLSIDVFPFGLNAHDYGNAGPTDYQNVVPNILNQYGLEGGTMYGKVMSLIRDHYKNEAGWGDLPIYVMFITDGNTMDANITRQQMLEASREGIFWQFMAIGEKVPRGRTRRSADEGFEFLEELDDMPGRLIDNADFFVVPTPDAPTDEELYDLMMNEYPSWLQNARRHNLIK
jgi:stress response protein SCP2